MKLPNPIMMEMMSLLEELFENPFPVQSRQWHTHQRLLRRAAEAIMSINHKINREIDHSRARGIVVQLEKDLRRISFAGKRLEAV